MAKKLRHALEIIWHNPTTCVVHGTGHMVIDYFRGYINPCKLQHNTLSSIGPFGTIVDKFIWRVLSNLVLVNQTLGSLSSDDF